MFKSVYIVVEGLSLPWQEGETFGSCLTALEQCKQRLSNQYSQAESTRIFWEKCPKVISVGTCISVCNVGVRYIHK